MQRLFPNNTFVSPQLPNPAKDLVRLVIAEAPGEEEALQGQPLVGGSGKVLNRLLHAAGIPRDGLTITNCIQCRPPDNVFPTDPDARKYISKEEANEAIRQCQSNHVVPLVNSRAWRRIDLLGDKPLRIVAGDSGGIFNRRGSPINVMGHRGMAILHPAYLMRDQVYLPVAANDLTKSLDQPPEYYTPFPSIEDVRAFKYKTFSFDIECPKYKTMGDAAPVEMVGLCGEPYKAMCVPLKGEYMAELRRIFSEAENIIGHNALQFDIPKLFKALDIEDQTT